MMMTMTLEMVRVKICNVIDWIHSHDSCIEIFDSRDKK